MADRDDAVWNTLRGNWNQMKGKVREKWGLLTNDDIEHIGGHKDRLVGKIQERYGKAKWEAAKEYAAQRGWQFVVLTEDHLPHGD